MQKKRKLKLTERLLRRLAHSPIYYVPEGDSNLIELPPIYDLFFPHVETDRTLITVDISNKLQSPKLLREFITITIYCFDMYNSLLRSGSLKNISDFCVTETYPLLYFPSREGLLQLCLIQRYYLNTTRMFLTYNPFMPKVLISSDTVLWQLFTIELSKLSGELKENDDPSFKELYELNAFIALGMSEEDKAFALSDTIWIRENQKNLLVFTRAATEKIHNYGLFPKVKLIGLNIPLIFLEKIFSNSLN